MKPVYQVAMSRSVLVLSVLWLGACSDVSREADSVQSDVGSEAASSGENSPPRIQSIQVLPQPPYRDTPLHADAKATDPDGDRIQYSYQWEKNGDPIEGATDRTLPGSSLKKGDKVTVTVTADDGQAAGEAATSDVVTVQNSPPMITFVTITPIPAYKKSRLTAVVSGQDMDGDDIDYSYQWFKNGQEIEDETSEALEHTDFTKGNVITVKVTPTDGQTAGGSVTSLTVTVENSPPRILSSPAVSLNDEDAYIYQISAEDPDGDLIQYSLTAAPDGMTVDSRSGLIQWSVTQEKVGVHSIEILAVDDDGAKTIQKYDLRIFNLQKESTSPPS